MKIFISLVHICIASLLIMLILIQSTKGGLGSAFGGAELYRTKRGAERIAFLATITLAALFLLTSVLNLIIR